MRWSWREYLLLDEIVKVCPGPEADTVELHAGDIFQRRVLSLTLPTADEASCWLLSMRALLRLTTLGDREFTLYLLDLFKMADRQRVGAITAQNRRMALAFLNLELERTASPNPSPNPYPNPNPNPNPNPCPSPNPNPNPNPCPSPIPIPI